MTYHQKSLKASLLAPLPLANVCYLLHSNRLTREIVRYHTLRKRGDENRINDVFMIFDRKATQFSFACTFGVHVCFLFSHVCGARLKPIRLHERGLSMP